VRDDERPSFVIDALAAKPHLVLDRGGALQVAAVACVDHCAHGTLTPLVVRIIA
jgi:hypothetical protein